MTRSGERRAFGRRHVVETLAVTSLLALAVVGGCRRHPPIDAEVAQQVKGYHRILNYADKLGALSTADQTRLFRLQTEIHQDRTVPDADLDFWISLLHKGPIQKDKPSAWVEFHTLVLEDALGPKDLTPAQQRKMYDAVLPYVSEAAYANDADPADPAMSEKLRTGNRKIALMLLAQTRDPRALGELAQVAQSDPSDDVRKTAGDLHDKLEKLLAKK